MNAIVGITLAHLLNTSTVAPGPDDAMTHQMTHRARYHLPVDPTEVGLAAYLPTATPAEILKAPPTLFVAGDTRLFQSKWRVAIVGSRDASELSLRRARKLAFELVRAGGVVVSGLALGVDTAAHLGALEAKGRTIAVIGTPLDKAYPAENAELQAVIARDHLLVSQFRSGTRVFPSNFVARNRTMALIAQASVIVEAGDSSGSLSQAAEAQRFGRPVFFLRSVLERTGLAWPQRFLDYKPNPARVLDNTSQLVDVLAST
jgi:DNA processing protein